MNNVVENKNAVPCESVIPEVRYKPDLPVSRNAFNKFVTRIYDVYAGNIDLARLMVLVLEAYLLGDMVMAMALLDRHGDRSVFMFLKQEVDAAVVRSRRAKALARIRMYSSIPEYVPNRVPEGMEIKAREPEVKKVETRESKVRNIKTRGPRATAVVLWASGLYLVLFLIYSLNILSYRALSEYDVNNLVGDNDDLADAVAFEPFG